VILSGVVLVYLWAGVTAYALFGGADFGAGFWDLLAGNAEAGAAQRARIEKSIGPVWEANHVWLIFALVVVWTGFPPVFAAAASTLYIPFSIAAAGIVLRGSAFAFRKEVADLRVKRLFGATFALSSVMTPFAFGTMAGAVASQRVPPGIAAGDILGSWVNPTSFLGGALAVGMCAYMAAVLLTGDARREGELELAEVFRRRALVAAFTVGAIALVGIVILHADAPRLYAGLTGRALPLTIASGVFGVTSLALIWVRRYTLVRGTAGLAIVAVIWAWGVAQYPDMLGPSLTVTEAAAPSATLVAMVVGLSLGALLVLPSLALLFGLFQRPGKAEQEQPRV